MAYIRVIRWTVISMLFAGITSSNEIKKVKIVWWSNFPYIYNYTGKMEGLIPLTLDIFANKNNFCGKQIEPDYSRELSSYGELEALFTTQVINEQKSTFNGSNDTVYAYTPLYISDLSNRLKTVKIADSKGQTLVYWKFINSKIYRAFVIGVESSIPLFLLAVVCTLLVALLIWMIEHKQNKDEFSENFFRGTCDGLYWATVTISTVGYGDKAPKTAIGKFITIIWMLFSMVLVSSFTALLTSGITDKSISLANRKVAVIPRSNFHQIVAGQRGIPVYVKTYLEGFQKVSSGEVFATLADVNTVASLQDHIYTKYDLETGDTFPTEQEIYFMLQNENWEQNSKFWDCISASTRYLPLDKLKPNPNSNALETKTFVYVLVGFSSLVGTLVFICILKEVLTRGARRVRDKKESVKEAESNATSSSNKDIYGFGMEKLKTISNDHCQLKIDGLTEQVRNLTATVKAQGNVMKNMEEMIKSQQK